MSLLDSSEAAWKDAKYGQVWEAMREEYDIAERFQVREQQSNKSVNYATGEARQHSPERPYKIGTWEVGVLESAGTWLQSTALYLGFCRTR